MCTWSTGLLYDDLLLSLSLHHVKILLTHTVAGGTNDDGADVGFGDGGVVGDGVGLSRPYEGFVVGGAVGGDAPTHGQKRL